jgi:succinate dehydrogenase/fumarate reductase-like Fe-S protein
MASTASRPSFDSPAETPGNQKPPVTLNQQDAEGFGGCTNIGECAAVCPAGVPLETISQLNFDLRRTLTPGRRD